MLKTIKSLAARYTLFVCLLLSLPLQSADFVFGYGSIISTESRSRSYVCDHVVPVYVEGLERGWMVHSVKRNITVLGVRPAEDAVCNGVLVEVQPGDLGAFDAREASYNRVQIDAGQVIGLDGTCLSDEDTVWVYVPKQFALPDSDFPIIQTYVDVTLSGCLEYDELFARDFVATTSGWEYPWVDDRASPFFQRPMETVAPPEQIDCLLADVSAHRVPRQ